MKISTRTFSDRGNESILTLREGLHALERLLPAPLLFGGTFLFDSNNLLQRFHLSPPREIIDGPRSPCKVLPRRHTHLPFALSPPASSSSSPAERSPARGSRRGAPERRFMSRCGKGISMPSSRKRR